MRAVILSDSHGDETGVRRMLEQLWKFSGKIDLYLHLGDGARDFQRMEGFLRGHDAHAVMLGVRGNCDFGMTDVPMEQVVTIGGAQAMMTHGHAHHVKQTYTWVDDASVSQGCTITLFGHTHTPMFDMRRTLLLNPGSAANGRLALLDVDEKGNPKPQLMSF